MGLLGRTVIPAGHVGIVRRRRGAGDEIFRNVTPDWNRRGTQARVLQPKQVYWLNPLTYDVRVVPAVSVPRNMIGLVRALEGRPQPAGARIGRHVECRSFEDGEAFLRGGGEQGVQADTLRGDHTYHINTDLFEVKFVPRTHVPDGTIGLVSAKIGKVRPAGRPFAKHVECDNFQDSARFIENGGQQGRQLAVLPGGTVYDVNTALFDVITADNVESSGTGLTREHLQVISIPIGYVGVVVTFDGEPSGQGGGSGWAEPPIGGHQSFQQPWTFLERGGRRGVQEEILRPGGLFAINPWFARVVLIPTRTLVLEWTERAHPAPGNFDAALEPIIINVQGHRIFMELSQMLTISEDAAPRLVSQFAPDKAQGGIGGLVDDPVPVQRFVERILGGTVAGYFNQIGGEEALSFVSNLASVQADLASQVRAALSEWGVKAEGTILGKFRADDPMLDAKSKEMFLVRAEQRKTLLEFPGSQVEILEIQTNAEKRRQLLTPQLLKLEMRINSLRPDLVAVTDIVRDISHASVPQFIGGSDAAAFLATLPKNMLPSIMRQIDELLNRRADPGEPTAEHVSAERRRSVSAGRHQLESGERAPGIKPPAGPGEPVDGLAGVSPAGRRYLKGQCQERVPVGEPFSLLASIVLEWSGGAAALKPFDVPSQGRDVLLVVHAPGLRLLGHQRMTVQVPADRDSEPVMFELRADDPGPRAVSVTAWVGGSYLGELLIEITAERGQPPGPHRDALAEIAAVPADGAVSLVVRYDPVQRAYRFEFRDEDNPDEVMSNLAYEPGPLVEQLVAELDQLARGRSGYSAAQARDYLVNAGARLWRELIPERLRQQFWERQHRIGQLTILTDRDAVPWELLYPLDPGHDAGFLVEQFPVTRAVFGRRSARELSLRPARFVLPADSPPKAREEIEAVRRLLDPAQPPGAIISELTPLQNLIGSGDFGVLHFACHNTYDPAAGSSIMLDSRFTPTLMTTAVIGKVLAGSAPVVFINACRSAGLAATYNRLDGWASKFLEAGAAAFIGSLWAVSDETARGFAGEFYGHLKAGASLGKAAMLARQAAAGQSGDPTWLAYTIYGDPRAMISRPQE